MRNEMLLLQIFAFREFEALGFLQDPEPCPRVPGNAKLER